MRRYVILVFVLFNLVVAYAQHIQVKSFQPLPMDMTASSLEGKRIDQNSQVAALIKIVTPEIGFTFEGGTLGIVDSKQENGEVWVWVPRASRKITIKHQQLGVLRDYRYPVEIEAERTYEMILTTGKIITTIEEEVHEQFLVFQIFPLDAMLEVNERVWPVSPEGTARRLMNFGTYSYRVQAQNYHTEAGNVTIDDPNEAKNMQITLLPNFGWIEVSGDGNLKGAAVYIDNTLAGKAPFKSEALKSGKHTVKIVREMYAPYSTTVLVNDNEITQVNPELFADFAHVTLQVDADAEIWVNDEKKGISSWTGDLANGTYKIECKKANHETTVTRKEITTQQDGEVIRLDAPAPIYGSLVVESTPDIATLFIDGKEEGKTPKLINKLLIGKHELKLIKDGYADHVEMVTIVKGERKEVNAVLNKKTNDVQQSAITQPLAVNSLSTELSDLTFTVNGVSFTMKFVEGGTFWMGAQNTDPNGQNYDIEAYDSEKPVHKVTLNNYWIGETEVTEELYKAVMDYSFLDNNQTPYYDSYRNIVNVFIPKLNQLTGRNFRLPTEAEWEYAARGGNESHGYRYAGSNNIDDAAWYWRNSGNKYLHGTDKKVNELDKARRNNGHPHPVRSLLPNELGLYDMSGNRWEWCSDWYNNYSSDTQMNPTGPISGSDRVVRGGNYESKAESCRISSRGSLDPTWHTDTGFRLALSE